MKKIPFFLLFFFCFVSYTHSKNYVNENINYNAQTTPPKRGDFIQATLIHSFGNEKLNEMFGKALDTYFPAPELKVSLDILKTLARTYKLSTIDYYRVKYYTADWDGTVIPVSGLMMVPKSSERINGIVLSMHPSITREQSPSFLLDFEKPGNSFLSVAINFLYGKTNNVVLIPDYVGLGDDNERQQRYVNYDTEGTTGLDMITATKGFLKNKRIITNGHLFLAGFSQGGHAGMSVLKKAAEENSYKFTYAYLGEGPYALNKIIDLVKKTSYYVVPGFLANTINTCNQTGYKIYGDPAEMVKPEFLDIYIDQVIGKGLFKAAVPQYLPALVTEQFWNDIKSDKIINLNNCIKANSNYDWKNTTPTTMSSLAQDGVVGPEHTIAAFNAQRSKLGFFKKLNINKIIYPLSIIGNLVNANSPMNAHMLAAVPYIIRSTLMFSSINLVGIHAHQTTNIIKHTVQDIAFAFVSKLPKIPFPNPQNLIAKLPSFSPKIPRLFGHSYAAIPTISSKDNGGSVSEIFDGEKDCEFNMLNSTCLSTLESKSTSSLAKTDDVINSIRKKVARIEVKNALNTTDSEKEYSLDKLPQGEYITKITNRDGTEEDEVFIVDAPKLVAFGAEESILKSVSKNIYELDLSQISSIEDIYYIGVEAENELVMASDPKLGLVNNTKTKFDVSNLSAGVYNFIVKTSLSEYKFQFNVSNNEPINLATTDDPIKIIYENGSATGIVSNSKLKAIEIYSILGTSVFITNKLNSTSFSLKSIRLKEGVYIARTINHKGEENISKFIVK